MTVNLSYDSNLSRVNIQVTDLPFDSGSIRIERSTNGFYWETVRGGVSLPVSGGVASLSDAEFSADVENTYRVVPIDPVAGLHLPGTAGSYASTPDHASLQITGDIDLRADATLDDWASGSIQTLIGKYTDGERAYRLRMDATGELRTQWSTTGGDQVSAPSTAALSSAAGRVAPRGTLDVDDGGGNRVQDYYTADTIDSSWGPFGSTVTTAGTTSIFAGASVLEVGSSQDGIEFPAQGVFHAAEVRDGIGGTIVADPRFDQQTMGASSFDDSTGKTWTIHGDAYLVGIETASITPSLDGVAWIKSIRHPFLNRPIHKVLAGGGQEIGRAARGGVFQVQGRSVPIAVSDVRSSRGFNLTLQVADEESARDMDLILASGDVFFIHVPPELTEHMSGGYVRIGDTVQHRIADTIKWRFELPCTVVAQPGPGVVGGTMTYGALLNLYGGYQNLLAANPTYADLLDLMASPDDLVVL